MEKISVEKLNDVKFLEGAKNISMYKDIDMFDYIGIIDLSTCRVEFEKLITAYNVIIYINNTLIAIFNFVKVVRIFANNISIDYELQD